ncbi:MAG: ribonuclease R, partial [Clostridia bacterium]|nr:ribonuclease R [Clostridia bacterium]
MKYINKKPRAKKREIKFTGTIQATERGFAFIIPDDKNKYKNDFFVPRSSLNGAYDGDRVVAEHVKGTKDEARIVGILERRMKEVVGTFERGIVYPDDLRLPEINVARSLCGGAKNGDKVLCLITAYQPKGTPRGKIVEVLGESGDFETEELSIIRSHGLYEEFPDGVLSQADEVSKQDIVSGARKDFRNKLIFTIDGADTRDIDDGVSLEIENGNYILGVHIADVSHYVKFHTPLDNEAYERGTSVYFPDRVLPMLPKALSNGACSLNGGEDRYALSCVMKFDKDGVRQSYEIFESVICSSHKTTYDEINAILDGDETVCKKYCDIVQVVKDMKRLCLKLESRRKSAGEVELDIREAKIYVDEDGEIIIPDYTRGVSERIIEQFMISANEAVAEFILNKNAPCLYRVHETPSPEKTSSLTSFLRDLGINVKLDAESVQPKDYRNILTRVADKPYAGAVNKVLLRSMQKARYCEKNLGHFGLASECYCHFTSPIRRYPDLFIHRVLKQIMHGGSTAKFAEIAEQAGIDTSERERIADEAEREVDALYKVVYMSDRIGDMFEATVSGVTNFGVFCELDNTIEGLIPIEELPGEGYELIPEKFLLKGTKASFRIGDKVKVCVDGCDYGRMRVM